MTVIRLSHRRLTLFTLGTALACGSGCDTDHAPVTIEPKVGPGHPYRRRFEEGREAAGRHQTRRAIRPQQRTHAQAGIESLSGTAAR